MVGDDQDFINSIWSFADACCNAKFISSLNGPLWAYLIRQTPTAELVRDLRTINAIVRFKKYLRKLRMICCCWLPMHKMWKPEKNRQKMYGWKTCLWAQNTMMTSSNGNIFRVTGPLCGEFTGPLTAIEVHSFESRPNGPATWAGQMGRRI